MSVDKRVALTSEVDGKTWYFCGPGCQEKFASSSGEPLADKSPASGEQGRATPET
jgi:YHS domain-containing protein